VNPPSDRQRVAQKARDLLSQDSLYLDTETTGLGSTAEIIEVAIINREGETVFESLVRPKGAIDPDARRVHGISMEMVQDAPTWQEVWLQIEPLLSNRMVGIYNSEFDLRMMRQSHQKYWMGWNFKEENVFCIMKLYARFRGEWDSRRGSFRWHSLEQAGLQSGILLPNSHRARDDAMLALSLMKYVAGF